MINLYRFAPTQFEKDISGEGAKIFGGRWNSKGNAVVYTSQSISLSLLELLIHSLSFDELLSNHLLQIELPSISVFELKDDRLKKGWQKDIEYTQFIGDKFLHSQSALLMRVPSAIIPQEYNVLINPDHKDFGKVKIASSKKFIFDARLFK